MVIFFIKQVPTLKLFFIFIAVIVVKSITSYNALRYPVNPYNTYILWDLPTHGIPNMEHISSKIFHWFVWFADAEDCFRIEFINLRSLIFNLEIN